MANRLQVLAAAAAISFFAGVGSSAAGTLYGGVRTVDISFDGYSDGLHLVINYNTGVVTGNRTGVASETVVGTVGSVLGTNGSGAITLNYNTFSLHVVIRDVPKKWVYYNASGAIQNSGTYSVGTPALSPASGPTSSTDE